MNRVTGQFSAEVRAALESDPTLVDRLAQAILVANFPPSLRPDIAGSVGLDVEKSSAPSCPGSADATPSSANACCVLTVTAAPCAVSSSTSAWTCSAWRPPTSA